MIDKDQQKGPLSIKHVKSALTVESQSAINNNLPVRNRNISNPIGRKLAVLEKAGAKYPKKADEFKAFVEEER